MDRDPQFPVSRGLPPKSTRTGKNELVALNFRVPFEFRRRMKLAATIRGVTMTELLTAALEHYLNTENGSLSRCAEGAGFNPAPSEVLELP